MLQKIIHYFDNFLDEGICIAFSGGVDSAFLLKTACLAREARLNAPEAPFSAGENRLQPAAIPAILAVIAETGLHPHEDTLHAQELAKNMGADCITLSVDELEDPRIQANPVNRCYLCKRLLFSSIAKAACQKGCSHIFDGTNLDDTKEYRPGLAALQELHIFSPLKDLGLTKQQVRQLSRQLKLPTSDTPSTPCMATRLPYGVRLDYALLDRIHKGEAALRSRGFYNVRLRYHEPILRIEVDAGSLEQLVSQRQQIISLLKELGFLYITLDLEGFRSGSMDLTLTDQLI